VNVNETGSAAGRRRCRGGVFVFAVLLALACGRAGLVAAAADANPAAAATVILVNARDPESVALGEFYADQRGIPRANLVALPMPDRETVTWREFVDQVWQPLQDELLRRHWIQGVAGDTLDPLGRRRASCVGHRIAYLVTCRGTPLRIQHDPLLLPETPPSRIPGQFRTNEAAVDSELSLLASGGHDINAFVANPLFRLARAPAPPGDLIVKVARLDGPTFADARRLVTSALTAERQGLAGRAYFDLGGIHPDGDRWLEAAAGTAVKLGFEVAVDRSPSTLDLAARFDAPALYFGWYSGAVNGPFARPGFQFPPGAIALHIHSYSAENLRSREKWAPGLVARGAAATFGNVFEPYLQFTHRPDLLLEALGRGLSVGDAAYYALPVLSWQAIFVGDPLYRPFRVSLAEQVGPASRLPPSLAAYAQIREAIRLEQQSGPSAALGYLRQVQRDHPSLPVAWRLAQAQLAAGQADAAIDTLAVLRVLPQIPAEYWRLGEESAALMAARGARATALQAYAVLARSPYPSVDAQRAMLHEARKLAEAGLDYAAAEKFKAAADALLKAPPP